MSGGARSEVHSGPTSRCSETAQSRVLIGFQRDLSLGSVVLTDGSMTGLQLRLLSQECKALLCSPPQPMASRPISVPRAPRRATENSFHLSMRAHAHDAAPLQKRPFPVTTHPCATFTSHPPAPVPLALVCKAGFLLSLYPALPPRIMHLPRWFSPGPHRPGTHTRHPLLTWKRKRSERPRQHRVYSPHLDCGPRPSPAPILLVLKIWG